MRNKIGPNEKCPCGSGKKYKKCCASKTVKTGANSYEDQTNRIYELINKRDFHGARAILFKIPDNYLRAKDLKKAALIISAALDECDAVSLDSYRNIVDEVLTLSVGTLLYERHCYERAIEWLKKAIELNPKNPNSLMNLGASYLGLNQYKTALDIFLKLEKIIGYSSSVLVNIAHCYASLNQIKTAESTLAKIKEIDRLNPAYLTAKAGLSVSNEEWEIAKETYAQLLLLYPENDGLLLSSLYVQANLNSNEFVKNRDKLITRVSTKNIDRFLEIELKFYTNQDLLSAYSDELHRRMKDSFFVQNMFKQQMHVYGALGDTKKVIEYEDKYSLCSERKGTLGGLLWRLCSHTEDNKELLLRHKKLLKEKSAICPNYSFEISTLKKEKIKIGYISSDFREHPVADFFEPIIARHNKEEFDTYCISTNPRDDKRTEQLRGYAGHWVHARGLDKCSLISQINTLNLDILIDLSGLTEGTNTSLFDYRMAKVQIGWIGYPFSTPAKEMDYKIVDNKTDPVGLAEDFYTEKLLRLPKTFSVFQPNSELKLVKLKTEAPCLKNEFITFGSLNNLAKVTDQMMECWANILTKVPNSRLFFKAPQFKFSEAKTRISNFFAEHGVSSDRLNLIANFETKLEGYEALKKIDICFDTSPYNGTTTTCETLYMGVPVVTLIGDSHRSRVSYSQLSSIGLEELAGETVEDYVEIAVRLAVDKNYLVSIRNGLRERMINSPLMAYDEFVEDYERQLKNLI